MRHILELRNFSLLTQQLVALDSSMLGTITLVGLIAVRQHTSTGFILAWHLWDHIFVSIYIHNLLDGQYLDLGSIPIPVVFSLQGGQEVTSLFVGKVTKICIFVIHIILHGCRKTILIFETDTIFGKI